jgi:hypothetical protein
MFHITEDKLNILRSIDILKYVIIDSWVKLVRQRIISAESLSPEVLTHKLDLIIDNLKAFLNTSTFLSEKYAKEYGTSRALSTLYSLDDMFTEFELLRSVIITYLYPFAGVAGARDVHLYIDRFCHISICEFIKHKATSQELFH